MESKVDVTIILPIYNPLGTWDEILDKNLVEVFELFQHLYVKVILVNDGTCFCMDEKLKQLKKKFPDFEAICHLKNHGKGFAVRSAILFAKSDYYIYTDWDFPFGKRILYDMFRSLDNTKCDIITGKRSRAYFQNLPFPRRIISECLMALNLLFLKFKKIDTQAGLKGLSAEGRDILLTTTTNSFIFELEFIRAALRKGAKLSSIEVTPDENIIFSNFRFKTIYLEIVNLFKILTVRT